MKINNNLIYGILAIIVALSIVNVYFINVRSQTVSVDNAKAKEEARPADIEIIKLTAECSDCFDIEKILTDLKSKNVNVKKEEVVSLSSDRGKQLISQFGIAKLPTLIVSGEVKKPNIESILKDWEEKDGKFVYKNILPPYTNPATNEVIGRVSVVSISDSLCEKCGDLLVAIDSLKKAGIVISEEKKLDYSSSEAQTLIKKFEVQKIPVLLISNNIVEYPGMKQALDQIGSNEKEGFFVLHAQVPPYRDTKTNEVKGFVNVTYLGDLSCKSCYNVTINKEIITRYGLAIVGEKNLDLNSIEGSNLIKKYNIEKVPIILVSPEASVYDIFANQVWPQVGSVESDGWFVMRNPELLGNYKNLTSGEEVVLEN